MATIEALNMESISGDVNTRTASWELSVNDLRMGMETLYASNHSDVDILLVSGFAETYIEDTAKKMGGLGVRLAVANMAYPVGIRLTPEVMEATVVQGMSQVINSINEDAGRPKNTPLYLIGHSIGFSVLAKLVEKYPEQCIELTGAAPYGVNCKAEAFGTGLLEHKKETKKRMRESGLLSLVSEHPDAERLAKEFISGSEFLWRNDVADIVRKLYGMRKLKKIVVGEDDIICPPVECKESINIEGMIVETKGGHDPLSSPLGLAQVLRAIKIMLGQE